MLFAYLYPFENINEKPVQLADLYIYDKLRHPAEPDLHQGS